jgi:hypothetical protein
MRANASIAAVIGSLPLVRGEVASPVQVLLNRPQGVLKGGKRPRRDLRHEDVCALVRLDDEPRAARLRDAPQGTAEMRRRPVMACD